MAVRSLGSHTRTVGIYSVCNVKNPTQTDITRPQALWTWHPAHILSRPHSPPRSPLRAALLAIALLAALVPRTAAAQQASSPQDPFSDAQRQSFYDQSARSHAAALGYSLALPGLGNIYADQPFTGALLMTIFGMSAVTLAFGLINDHDEVVWTGSILLGATYTAGAITSYFGVRDYNHQLRIRYRLAQQPAPVPTIPLIAWEF
jgi:hypothetical protein